jgi:hypothetical protein
MENFGYRWLRQAAGLSKKKTSWVAVAFSLLVSFVQRLFEHRLYSFVNDWLDARSGVFMNLSKEFLLWFIDHPIVWPVAIVGLLAIISWMETMRKSHLVLAEHESVQLPPVAVPQPEPRQVIRTEKPTHNVQCVGFKVISSDPFTIAAMRFQNVPTGKLMGKFERPRLRVVYYEQPTGQEIADMCPIPWWDEKDGITDISADGRDADIASYFEGKWTVNEENEPAEDFDSWHKLNSVEVPAGDIRIIATLSGAYNLRIPPVTGVLTLEENGNASFVQDVL